jgi:putative DNA primase/helicase
MSNELVFARQLHTWGVAVTAIKRSTKRPAHRWKHWQDQHQTEAEFDALPWRTAVAIGIVNGSGGFRIFDIDAVKGPDGLPAELVPEKVVVDLLCALDLPDDYQWSYRSGSGAGFGVIVRCEEELPADWAASKGIFIGAAKADYPFGNLELRWSKGQTVIDGAHPTGPGYQWRRGERPFQPPAIIKAVQVINGFKAIAEQPETGSIQVVQTPPNPTSRKNKTAAGGRYAAAALSDATRQVSLALPGERNDTLFRQTASIAELVNGGELDRAVVETSMTTAALTAGLSPEETQATINSAFMAATGKVRYPKPSVNGSGARGELSACPQESVATNNGNPIAYKLNDTGNAERFASRYRDIVRYNHSTDCWLIWVGTHWQRDDDGEVQRLAKECVLAIYEEAAEAARAGHDEQLFKWARTSGQEPRRKALLNLARSELPIAITHDRLNRGDYLLNVRNGTLNLQTGQLQPHKPGDLLTYVLPVEYDKTAKCPGWEQFLKRITGGDGDMMAYLARAVGYTLSGSTDEQCLFFLYGRGANGKSTFVETIMALLDELAAKVRSEVLIQSERDRVPNEIAALAGKRLVVMSELPSSGRLNEGVVKDLTGGDTISARFLYGEPFQFKPTCTLWLYGNHKPTICGVDDGIWRRIHLIPFEVQIPIADRDPYLLARLREEFPGILAWVVGGWRDYCQYGLRPPARVTGATSAYRAESDILGKFLEERCYEREGALAEAGKLYEAYKAWAEENGLYPLSNVRFSRLLIERGFIKKKNTGTKRQEYYGLGLLSETR